MEKERSKVRTNQKEMLENENSVREMKNVFDELISWLDMAKEGIN